MSFTTTQGPPSVTHYMAANHDGDALDAYRDVYDECYFCGHSGAGLPADDVISEKYFSDHPLRDKPNSDVVCAYCAYCMDHRGLKQGHWLVTGHEFRSVSTGDLLDAFREIQAGEVEPPLALHVSENPIRSEHAYLWTPVSETTAPLVVDYDGQRVRVAWEQYHRLLDAVEELRWHGFRGADIRSGEPRVGDLQSIGRERYRELDAIVEPYRATPFLELVWTVSYAKSDQSDPPPSA